MSLSSAITVLVVPDIPVAKLFLLETFGSLVAPTSPSQHASSTPSVEHTSHSLLCVGKFSIVLVTEATLPPLLHKNTQLVMVVENIEAVVKRAVEAGGKVLQESVQRGSPLYVIESPQASTTFTLILSESPPTSTSAVDVDTNSFMSSLVSTFTAWLTGVYEEDGEEKGSKENRQSLSSAAAVGSDVVNPESDLHTHWSPPPGTVIPTLFPSVLHDGEFRKVAPNSSFPIPFKTEYFEGEVLLLVRTTPLEPRYKHIFQKVSELTKKAGTTTFEVQCQGKFTKKPEGMLYIGAEITKKMNLGMFTRGVCYTVLQFVNSINPFIHSSFGDSKGNELPHITGPLWCLADKIIVTPEGKIPPKLGQILPEDRESRAQRRSHTLHEETVDLTSTYSFSVNTDNIEVCDWNMVNIPLTNSMDLHTFWDDADLRLCCYCVPPAPGTSSMTSTNQEPLSAKSAKSLAKSLPKYHYQATNQYLLCLQLEHLSNHPGRSPNTPSTEEKAEPMVPVVDEPYYNMSQQRDDNEDDDDDSIDSDGAMFFDTVHGHDDTYFSNDGNIMAATTRKLSRGRSVAREVTTEAYNFVPAAILASDVVRHRSMLGVGSSQRELYLFCVPSSLFPGVPSASASYITIQSFKDFDKQFDVEGCFKTHAYTRMSKTEQRRRDLAHSMEKVLQAAKSDSALRERLVEFFGINTHLDYFLRAEKINSLLGKNNGVGNPRLRADLDGGSSSSAPLSPILIEGFVCTRQGQTHWSEEYLCVTAEELIFIQHSPRLNLTEKKRRRVPWVDVLSLKVLTSNEVSFPLEDSYCVLLNTFPKEFAVLIRDKNTLDRWLEVLPSLLATRKGSTNSGLPLANSFKQQELFSHSMDWKLGSRILLNGRQYCGRSMFERPQQAVDAVRRGANPTDREEGLEKTSAGNKAEVFSHNDVPIEVQHTSHNYPLLLVEKALRLISEISVFSNSMENILSWDYFLESHWIEYLNLVSILPCVNLHSYKLSNDEIVCLYLNLYHAMLLHAVLVAGVPSTLMRWPVFFNSFSYEAFGDIMSLSELEHAVVKGGFKTTGLLPQVVIRQSKYDLPLPQKDFRLLFALNCGSLSMPAIVSVFQPAELEDQLDRSVRDALLQQLHVSKQSIGKMFTVRLPLVCEWYETDVMEICNQMSFSSEYKKATKLLRLFINYCGTEQKDILLELITNDKSSYSLKYSKFDFRCRILKIQD